MKLPIKLRNPKEEVITINNNDQKSFLWCHIGHIDPVKIHSKRTNQNEKK